MQKVFLVEDSRPVRERLLAMLAAEGHAVVGEATTAQEAIEGIRVMRPDAVVLDLSLAQGSGFDVLRAIHGEAPEIDCYMLSNFASDAYRRHAERLGARGFYDKTTEFRQVCDAIARRELIEY